MEEQKQLSQNMLVLPWCMGCLLWYHIIFPIWNIISGIRVWRIFNTAFPNNKRWMRATICRAIFDDAIRASVLIWKRGVWNGWEDESGCIAICTTAAGAATQWGKVHFAMWCTIRWAHCAHHALGAVHHNFFIINITARVHQFRCSVVSLWCAQGCTR